LFALIKFLAMAVGISLSGVMAPGPMTTATIAAGAKNRHAGILLALGHAVIEFPLMLLIVAGMGALFESEKVKIGIGLTGGVFLVLLALSMLRDLKKNIHPSDKPNQKGPLATGIILTAGNPYFLLWWATIGLALATQAVQFGKLAFVLFALIHWLCDLIWLEALSWASFKGTELFGPRTQRLVLKICAIALFFFAGKFLIDAGTSLHTLLTTNS
jgi:threonine/homoserine/homoserine lactone efflux protein